MPNQNSKNQKNYDAGDMYDIQSMAKSDMNWLNVALSDIRLDFIKLSEELKAKGIPSIYLTTLQTKIDMYSYIAEERHDHHADMAKIYEAEWKEQGGDE